MVKFAKDPKAPKRPQSAYFLFAGDVRASVMEKHGNDIAAVGKAIGKMYHALAPAELAKYQTKAAKAKAVYDKKRAAYVQTAGYKKWVEERKEFNKQNKQEKKLKKLQANRPKRAMSAYMLFAQQHRAKIVAEKPNLNGPGGFKAIAQATSAAWKAMSDAQKAPFNKKAKAQAEKAAKKLAKYKQGAEYKAYVEAVKSFRKEKKAAAKAGKKNKKAVSKKQK